MKILARRGLFLTFIFLLSACTIGPFQSHEVNVSAGHIVQSDKKRSSSPQVSAEDQRALAQGSRAFALDLYHALGKPSGNFFFSPYSITLALSMTYAGARGETASQMADVMHFQLPADRLHPALNALDQELASRKDLENSQPGGGKGSDGKGFRLNLVNDIWGQQGFSFLPAFLDLLAQNYGAGLRLIDFQANPEDARQQINQYITDQTEKRIQNLLPPGSIDEATRLVLTNAIYFNAAWFYPFDTELTKPQAFTRLDGSSVDVPMMRVPGAKRFNYRQGDGFQAIELPYENTDLSMLIIVPDEGRFADFETSFSAVQLATLMDEMQSTEVVLKMPSFSFDSDFDLADNLQAMGMSDAFNPGAADFSGMDGARDIYIGAVVHKAFVKVDEAGTEAAAASAVAMRASAMPNQQPPVELTIDRPFIFLIVDAPTQSILFMGRVTDPSGQ